MFQEYSKYGWLNHRNFVDAGGIVDWESRRKLQEDVAPFLRALQRRMITSNSISDEKRRADQKAGRSSFSSSPDGVSSSSNSSAGGAAQVAQNTPLLEKLAQQCKERVATVNAQILEKELQITVFIELQMQLKRGSICTSPAAAEIGVKLVFGNTTQSAHDALRAAGLTVGRTTATSIVNGLVDKYIAGNDQYLEDVANDDLKSMLVIFDINVMPRWMKRLISDQQFTQQLATMSVLLRSLSTPDGAKTTVEEAAGTVRSIGKARSVHQNVSQDDQFHVCMSPE